MNLTIVITSLLYFLAAADYQEHQDDNTLGRPKKNILEYQVGQKRGDGIPSQVKAEEKAAKRSFFEIE